MRKLLVVVVSLLVFLLSSILSIAADNSSKEQPIFLGLVKGSIKEYCPDIQIINAFFINYASTSGIVRNIPQHLVDESFNFAKHLKNDALEICAKKGATFAAVDQFEIKFTMIGEYQTNILIQASGNIICAK